MKENIYNAQRCDLKYVSRLDSAGQPDHPYLPGAPEA